ncbi:MAG: hypothetical protein L6246_02000 [Thermodesulfovibrionales bacterium]|nr:hypothetical protein [Thermodesulfovibrionales bacterium]
MITPAEEDYINSHAYLPEHLPGYVTAISGTEPYLINDYLCYYGDEGHLIFIGYPLKTFTGDRNAQGILDQAVNRFKPKYVALIAPEISIPVEDCHRSASACYYKLDLSDLHVSQKLRNMIRHASRELCIEKSQEIKDEHLLLISEFMDSHKIDADTRYIFERIPKYLSSVSTAWVFSARNEDKKLVTFDIAEFGARDYIFYMFNFMSRQSYMSGASDLILYEIIKTAQEMGKSFVNLGLGINEGVAFFKKKWGGAPFLNYEFCLYERTGKDKLRLF